MHQFNPKVRLVRVVLSFLHCPFFKWQSAFPLYVHVHVREIQCFLYICIKMSLLWSVHINMKLLSLILMLSFLFFRPSLLPTNGDACDVVPLSSTCWLSSSRLISQSMGIFRRAPPTFATCLNPPLPSPGGLLLAPTHCVIQPSIQPSISKMTLELTEWSSIWIFTACNRQ